MDDFGKVLDEGREEIPAAKTQDDPTGRPWTWEEDGFTVIRSNARSGPGCHDNCGVLMYVKDGVLEKIEGDPENPFNQGRLCPRCLAFKEMLYHKDRLKHPLKRKKEDRGKNTFERISWDEAYDIIEREMKAVIDKYGARSIWVTQGTGRDINGYGPLMAQYFGTPNYGTGFLSGQACYAPRMFSTTFKSGGLFVCDYSQFFPDRYDDPRWSPPEYFSWPGAGNRGGYVSGHCEDQSDQEDTGSSCGAECLYGAEHFPPLLCDGERNDKAERPK